MDWSENARIAINHGLFQCSNIRWITRKVFEHAACAGIYCYHFCQLCACVNEPFLTTQSMLPLDKIGNPEHALTIIIWYLRACSQLQKAIVSEHYH